MISARAFMISAKLCESLGLFYVIPFCVTLWTNRMWLMGLILKNRPYQRSRQTFQVEIFVKKRSLTYKWTNWMKNTDNFT